MNLLNTLTAAADEEQLQLHPLPEHAAVAQEEHFRRHYALLLAAMLTSQASISEPQTRLFAPSSLSKRVSSRPNCLRNPCA